MLVELKTDEDKEAEEKGEMKDKGKDLPLKSGDKSDGKSGDKKDKKKSYGFDSKSGKSSKGKKKKLDEKEKSSLRKTLEKMMGK